MFALKLIRFLIVLSLVFVLCSSAKSFLKGLLVGALLGHKKASLLNDKEESKDVHHYDNIPAHKEYIPIHEEPRYIPIYIVKECKKPGLSVGLRNGHHVVHHHDHQHNFGAFEHSASGMETMADEDNAGKYLGSLDGYESRDNGVKTTKKSEFKENNENDIQMNENQFID